MSVTIAFLADTHISVQARRKNIFSLSPKRPLEAIDTVYRGWRAGRSSEFWPFKASSHNDEVLLAAADKIEQIKGSLDRIVVLGDLATTGYPDDLAVAQTIFLSKGTDRHLTASADPRFGGLGVKLLVLPGNHDRYQDYSGTPGGVEFENYFGSIYKPKNGVTTESIEGNDLIVGLITADFCFPAGAEKLNLVQKLGWGRVTESVLNELRTQTVRWKTEHPSDPVIWAIHFSPGEGVDHWIKLDRRELLLKLATELGVRVAFCGHTHKRKREFTDEMQLFTAGTVCSIDAREHFFHVCRISRSGESHTVEVFDFAFDGKESFVGRPLSLKA
jgi:3',5'-cyclic AMP phosphodiesterase CpdA